MPGNDTPTPLDEEHLDQLRRVSRAFMHHVPHNRALGIELVAQGYGEATMRLPYDDRLVGNPLTGVLHGGAISALLDACSGSAVFMKLSKMAPIATLDLRIDYLKPASPRQPVTAHALCYKLTRNIGFTRCSAYHQDPEDPIAFAAGTFMLGTPQARHTT